MYKTLFSFLLISTLCYAQTSLNHVVYFDTDKFNIIETEKNRLLNFIDSLNNKTIKKINIYGFCDDRGTDQYNLILSQKRADAIKNIFQFTNTDLNLISNVDGKGEILLKKINTKDINTLRSLNRKVEIEIELFDKINIDEFGRELPLTLESNLLVGDKVILQNVLFETGYSYVLKESIPILEKTALILKEKSNLYFTIEGHVCCTSFERDAVDRGTGKRNLSFSRARFIYNYLLKRGIDKKRMKYIGLKHKFPLGGDSKFDRRVEIEITSIKN